MTYRTLPAIAGAFLACLLTSTSAMAAFRVEHAPPEPEPELEPVEVAPEPEPDPEPDIEAQIAARLRGDSPDGYRVLSDKQAGVVLEIGERPASLETTSSAGEDVPLADALALVMPRGWVSYIEADAPSDLYATWHAENATFVDVLDAIGVNQGIRFVVDWSTGSLRLGSPSGYAASADDSWTQYADAESGRRVFVYSADPLAGYRMDPDDDGVVIIGDRAVGLRVVD